MLLYHVAYSLLDLSSCNYPPDAMHFSRLRGSFFAVSKVKCANGMSIKESWAKEYDFHNPEGPALAALAGCEILRLHMSPTAIPELHMAIFLGPSHRGRCRRGWVLTWRLDPLHGLRLRRSAHFRRADFSRQGHCLTEKKASSFSRPQSA